MIHKIILTATSSTIVLLISGCASLYPKNFDPASERSLVVVVNETPPRGYSSAASFRRLDSNKGIFISDFTAVPSFYGSPYALKEDLQNTDLTFTINSGSKTQTYIPGDYALISVSTSGGGNSPTMVAGAVVLDFGETIFDCYQNKAPIFSLKAGEIVIVPTQKLNVKNEDILLAFTKIRQNYPEINGNARVAKMDKYITFGNDTKLDKSNCQQATVFSKIK